MSGYNLYVPLLLCYLVAIIFAQERSVDSKAGVIKGKIENVTYGSKSSSITKFLGIPFAESPTGERRFARPVKKAAFTTPFAAFEYGPSCIQNDGNSVNNSEDCLYLNVFTPDINGSSTKYAVIVFIYGGGFNFGSASIYAGERLAAYGNVVVVTFNYRLGPFGFLDVGDKSLVQPNNGLMDQHLAIKWVRDNIDSFGGDKSRVTIMGESAGSASVIFQSLYPLNDGLFQRAIAQSGTVSDVWALSKTPIETAKDFATSLNCPVTSTEYLVQCLKEYNDTTMMTQKASEVIVNVERSWSPTYDNDLVVKENIDELIKPTKNISLPVFDQIDLLMGTTSFEGQMIISAIPEIYNVYKNKSYSIEDVKETNKQIFRLMNTHFFGRNIGEMLLDDVIFQYSNFEDPLNRNKHIVQAVNYITDRDFLHRTHATIMRHTMNSDKSKTYRYEFDDIYPSSLQDEWVTGATHASEMTYLFGFPKSLAPFYGGYNDTTTQPLWQFSTKLIKYWTNFAKSGDPNGNNLVEWKEFNTTNQDYLYLKSNQIQGRHHLHARRTEFWNSRLPMLVEKIKNTPPPPTGSTDQCISSSNLIHLNTLVIVTSLLLLICTGSL